MSISRLLPNKFSTRLFVITLVAGLIPIVIFSVLIHMYAGKLQPEIRKAIQQAHDREWTHNKALLNKMGETSIQQKARDVSLQLELVLVSHPYMTLRDLQRDRKFRELAVQTVGQTGYTAIHETSTGIIRFHKDVKLENKSARNLAKNAPSLWKIVRKSREEKETSGYYEAAGPGGKTISKYIYVMPLRRPTADDVLLSVSVSADMDEFSKPINDAEAILRNTADYLSNTSERLFRTFQVNGLLFMGAGIFVISCIAFGVGAYFSRAITHLREATRRVNEGDLTVSVKPSMSGEVKTLTEDFNRMVAKLADTTVSKELLEKSESKLREANTDLQREIMERISVEKALDDEKEHLAVTLRSIGDGVITTDTAGKIVLMNQVAEMLTGWEQKEVQGRFLPEVFYWVDENRGSPCENPVERIMGPGGAINFPDSGILVSRDGTERVTARSGSPIRNKDGVILGIVIVFRDITEKRKLEEELLKVRKLESVGTLAGGIAHDFNNLLAVILGNISLAKLLVEPEGKASKRLIEAENATMRSKELTYRLLTFARGGEPVRRVTPLQEIIRDASVLSLAGSSIRCEFRLSHDLHPARVDEAQIRQVIHNLLTNGREAMPDGGTITIEGENVTLTADDAIPLPDGDYLRISITDQGIGIPEEDLLRIFDPYFTTKDLGNQKGMGLGLAICYSIVKNHDGFMTVKSRLGIGTTLIIYLPAHREIKKEIVQEDTRRSLPPGGRILYMDDEEALRNIAGQILNHMGYEVQSAVDGVEAIALYTEASKAGKPFDLVIMDLTIPGGMGGKETVQRLLDIDPRLKAIVSSGYSNDPIMRDFKAFGFAGAVAKPYNLDDLGKVISRIMADARG